MPYKDMECSCSVTIFTKVEKVFPNYTYMIIKVFQLNIKRKLTIQLKITFETRSVEIYCNNGYSNVGYDKLCNFAVIYKRNSYEIH